MLREGKYYFDREHLVKVLWVSKTDDMGCLYNFSFHQQYMVYLPGANLALIPAMKIGEVARILDCHPDTIRKWEQRGVIERQPSWEISPGVTWRFYSPKDVRDIRDAASEIHRGRPRMDKRKRSNIPSKGTTDKIIRDLLRRNSA